MDHYLRKDNDRLYFNFYKVDLDTEQIGRRQGFYGVDPVGTRCDFSRRELEQIRRQLPGSNRTLGPATAAEAAAFRYAVVVSRPQESAPRLLPSPAWTCPGRTPSCSTR